MLEELGAGAAVFGRDSGEVRLLRARRLSIEKGEHYGALFFGVVLMM